MSYYTTALPIWLILCAIPVAVSLVYFRSSPVSETLSYRLLVSAHGAAISMLSFAAFFIGTFTPRQNYAEPFAWLLLAPVILIVLSFIGFNGRKLIHFLQLVNVVWLFFLFTLGSMAISGTWL